MYDPLRHKEVPATPEENVRQWFIDVLIGTCGVPAHMMMSEVGFNYAGKPYRADILVYDRSAQPLAIVECKRPEVAITGDVARQALRYDAVLSARYIMLTNGSTTYVYVRNGGTFRQLDHVPAYDEMICLQ